MPGVQSSVIVAPRTTGPSGRTSACWSPGRPSAAAGRCRRSVPRPARSAGRSRRRRCRSGRPRPSKVRRLGGGEDRDRVAPVGAVVVAPGVEHVDPRLAPSARRSRWCRAVAFSIWMMLRGRDDGPREAGPWRRRPDRAVHWPGGDAPARPCRQAADRCPWWRPKPAAARMPPITTRRRIVHVLRQVGTAGGYWVAGWPRCGGRRPHLAGGAVLEFVIHPTSVCLAER